MNGNKLVEVLGFLSQKTLINGRKFSIMGGFLISTPSS